MNILVIFGSFGIAAAALVWAYMIGILSIPVASFFVILIIIAGLIFPFFYTFLFKRNSADDENKYSLYSLGLVYRYRPLTG